MLEYHRFKTVCGLFMEGRHEEARLELTELQRRYVAVCDELTTFKMQVQEYEDILYLARNLVLSNGLYWLITGNIKQGPFCPHCYDGDGLLMRLSGEFSERYCTCCRKSFVVDLPFPAEAVVGSNEALREEQLPLPTKGKTPRGGAKVIPFGR